MEKTAIKTELEKWNAEWKKKFPEADMQVLQFITNFVTHAASTEEEYEIIRSTFRAGYCYHFAVMLKAVFKRGEVCWAAPFGHFVWVDDNGIPYDVEGMNFGEQLYNIPESYLGGMIKEFMHVPGDKIPLVTDEDIIKIIRQYEDDNGLPHKNVELYHIKKINSFIVSWHASGYTGTFNYMITADTLEEAKALWEKFVADNDDLKYSWEKAVKGEKLHTGGYTRWKETGLVPGNKQGCYEMPYDDWNTSSDHLWD